MTYACTGVEGPESPDQDYSFLCDGFTAADGQLTLMATGAQYLSGELVPGDYTFMITGTSPTGQTAMADF